MTQPAVKPLISKVATLRDFPVTKGTKGTSVGAFATIEGLCAVVLPQQANDPVRIGLLAGHHHVATLKLHRDAVDVNDTWQPSVSDDDHHFYALKGLQINIKTAQASKVEFKHTKVTDECAADDIAWQNLGWALDVRDDLKGTGALKQEWWNDARLVDAVLELDRGSLEGGFDGNEPIQIEPDIVKWKMPDGSKRVLKQVIRYRLGMQNVTLEAGPLGAGRADRSLTLRNDMLVYLGIKHFPLGPKRDRLAANTPLDETKAYYSLLAGFGGSMVVPYALDKSEDCPKPATPDCTCCPPGIYS
jgi:hypothetical protein